MKLRLGRFILTVIIIVIIVAIFILVVAELDRLKPRNVECDRKMYYDMNNWITAPFNYYARMNVVDQARDIGPFPSMKHNFPNHKVLRNNWKGIRDEVLRVYERGAMKKIQNDFFFTKIADEKWKRYYIKWYDAIGKDAWRDLPFTCDLIDSLPEVKSAMISVLEPGSRITPHQGPFFPVTRYHLGLKTPKKLKKNQRCWIKVDGIEYQWKDGEDMLFDDTYVHEVHNDTDEVRIILFCDIQRPMKNKTSKMVSDFACKVAKVTTRNNK